MNIHFVNTHTYLVKGGGSLVLVTEQGLGHAKYC